MERTRKECYDYIKSNKKLQNKIYKETGWYYQNLTNAKLNVFVSTDYNSFANRFKRLFKK